MGITNNFKKISIFIPFNHTNIMKQLLSLTLALILSAGLVQAQKQVTLKSNPDPIVVEVGKTLTLEVEAIDTEGNLLKKMPTYFFPLQLKGVQQNMIFTGGITVDESGVITANKPGTYQVIANRAPDEGEAFGMKIFDVTVMNQPVAEVKIENVPNAYAGSIFPLNVQVTDKGGYEVERPQITMKSSNPDVVKVDRFQNVYALQKGKATITASIGGVNTDVSIEVLPNPVTSIALENSEDLIRTGDVVNLKPQALDKNNKPVADVPLTFSVSGNTSEYGTGAAAMVDQDGRFVAEQPGIYTVTVSSGNQSVSTSVEVVERHVSRQVTMKGHGRVGDKNTSDLWVWEGVDGKDYAVTGTWGADGKAYFWDVTNPANILLIDSIQVDARTVNDVKVSEDGKTCVISREGASNRKNGIVILDVTNPSDVQILSTYTENLTGGVHNVFINENYVYALSNGQWYEIIDISDPKNPKGVSKFVLPNSMESIHDVWVVDGIAYSSNWSNGIAMVDVGNGIAGGSPENPVEIARAHVQGDANHAAFPYKSKDTGKFYVIAGDEIFPLSAMTQLETKEIFPAAGYLHFMDMTDPENPREVARYEVPEAGSHNFWVEDDLLYIGYYNGGLRVVDISGDLMGDLYKQGREIARYLPYDEEGFVPNAPFVWGAQPHKGHIFFSDFNSGLWSAQLAPVQPEKTTVETK
jgi:hypothetical protein